MWLFDDGFDVQFHNPAFGGFFESASFATLAVATAEPAVPNSDHVFDPWLGWKANVPDARQPDSMPVQFVMDLSIPPGQQRFSGSVNALEARLERCEHGDDHVFVNDAWDRLRGASSKDTTVMATDEPSGEEIVVIGYRYDEGGTSGGGGADPYDPNTSIDTGEHVGSEQNCGNTNDIGGVTAPDGATYYSPEGVTADYLTGALNHISSIFANNPFNKLAVKNEIEAMYTDPSHPYFVDFKDWGTDSGPLGSISGGTITWYSDAAGAFVSGSAFEPFGNYFFGILCTFGGLAPEEIYAAAAWSSESGSWWDGDDPQDTPHVEKGIADAQSWLSKTDEQRAGNPIFTISETNCDSGL